MKSLPRTKEFQSHRLVLSSLRFAKPTFDRKRAFAFQRERKESAGSRPTIIENYFVRAH